MKTTKKLSQDSRHPGRDLNPEPPKYEKRVLTTRPRRSVIILFLSLCLFNYVTLSL
jgi:hypothetical protein